MGFSPLCSVANLKTVSLRDKVNLIAIVVMTISLFGFLGNVMIDFNWGSNLITSSLALTYWMTLRVLIPFPLNYWGVGAAAYFVVFLLSFAVLNRGERLATNFLETIRLASVIIILFEIGVFYFVREFMDKWIVQALRDTQFASFTNWDLLFLAVATMVASHFALMKMKSSTATFGAS